MIANPTLYVNSFALNPVETVILNGIISIRLRGKKAQPGYKELALWVKRGTRTAMRSVALLQELGLLKRIRRGKRLTNIYYVAYRLWHRLIAGRKVRREREDRHAEVPLEREKALAFWRQLRGADPPATGD